MPMMPHMGGTYLELGRCELRCGPYYFHNPDTGALRPAAPFTQGGSPYRSPECGARVIAEERRYCRSDRGPGARVRGAWAASVGSRRAARRLAATRCAAIRR